jgi:hypothetical protein
VVSDLLSIFAGPTRTLVEEDSPVLDVLVLVFPTFGSVLGFGLSMSDFVFLALFAAASRFLNLRYVATLICLCSAAFLAVTAGLLLGRPLPTPPSSPAPSCSPTQTLTSRPLHTDANLAQEPVRHVACVGQL